MYIEIRAEKKRRSDPDRVWMYRAETLEEAVRLHLKIHYAARAKEAPDFWTLYSLDDEGEPSRVDGRQVFEAKYRTERAEGLPEWFSLRYIARPLSGENEDFGDKRKMKKPSGKPPGTPPGTPSEKPPGEGSPNRKGDGGKRSD
ncbi:MAG: hypothetical protein R3C52_14860 [Hyphomonadaceae bacterium]